MPSAARVTDLTVHGGTVAGPGVATVLIAGLPAAVLGDLHACPVQPGHPPSTPFTSGSPTVLIGGRPALRVGDLAGCGASVGVGAPTVVIG
ncbi:PaaR repeat-containing protein [Streptomyces sp. HUCO-GS316]|uniref:PAAR domain-containing protein n=1 Tax=Streptomyces sp. HUCO-GS316 TaxID=2692198 RepID=UPI00136892F0|nr:PAAR domain-containing protein [Streptomyces sp. HUCO-GS316]MXM66540.1 PaaR repeat-containing protein [Streptomyces sp. HUCO-GS316]